MQLARDIVKAVVRHAPFKALRQRRFLRSRITSWPAAVPGGRSASPVRVLVLGVYLGNRPNHAAHLRARFAAGGAGLQVEQRWTALNGVSDDPALRAVTRSAPETGSCAKFALINRMLQPADIDAHDFIVVCDDDILLPDNFLEALLAHQTALDWSVVQPARTLHSHFDHLFAMQRPWLRARQTRFVECGPLVSFRRDAARLLMPFEGEDAMWGLDLVWPLHLGRAGLKMGIVDAVMVDHSLRPQASSYSKVVYDAAMHRFLAATPHLPMHQAFAVVARHWRGPLRWPVPQAR